MYVYMLNDDGDEWEEICEVTCEDAENIAREIAELLAANHPTRKFGFGEFNEFANDVTEV